MQVNSMVKIHNKFDVVVRNAETGVIEEIGHGETGVIEEIGHGENIVLDRIYSRLLNFQTYFDQIVFGSGIGTPIVSRTTLFNRINSKPAITDQLIRAYPTSVWTKKITLGTEEFNGSIITEVGISNETTNINTHAMITDAEGNPLSVEKTSIRIIDIYATVFIEIYDVDTGLWWYDNGLRDYLTGGSAPSNTLGISNLKAASIATITGTKTIDLVNKSITVVGRFNVDSLNKDARFLYWTGAGLACEVPRPGVFEGRQMNNMSIGIGDGVNKNFHLGRSPNTPIESLAVFVDGIVIDFSYNKLTNIVTTNISPATGAVVTANYKSMYYPKTTGNVIDSIFKIKFGVGQPSPIVPPPPQGIVPGVATVVAGDSNYGFYGEVFPDDLINGEYLARLIGLTSGTIQNTDASWLKFVLDGKILFVAKKPLRHTISWDAINAVNAVYGGKTIEINGLTYKVRLMKTGLVDPMPNTTAACHGSEWNKLMLPIHIQAKDKSWAYPANVEVNVPYWGVDYTDADLLTHSSFGNGSYSWCQETYSSNRVNRGNNGVSNSNNNTPSNANNNYGWRPVLAISGFILDC